jgi:hypothetical protein
MAKLQTLALASLMIVGMAAVPAPAGNGVSCGLGLSNDATFSRTAKAPSASAAKVCAMYLNTVDVASLR